MKPAAAVAVQARDLALAGLVVLVALPLWALPWGLAARLGTLYGRVAGLFWPLGRRVSMINLRRAFGPPMSRRRARRMTAEVFGNLGRSLADGIQLGRRSKAGTAGWEPQLDVEDPCLERALLADPRPKVFVTGHLGSWEVATRILASRATRGGAAIARKIDNPYLDALVRRLRLSDPSQLIEKQGAVSEALARLRAGESIAMLLDENGGWRGLFVPFFGRVASTRRTPALLSLKTGAPIVLGAAVRRGGRFLYRLAVIDPVARGMAGPEAVAPLTREITAQWEAWVRDDPAQWRWIHWRWRNQPDGSVETYTRKDLEEAFR
jgi:KDO2-lipid IV(A) lauroyltransferase